MSAGGDGAEPREFSEATAPTAGRWIPVALCAATSALFGLTWTPAVQAADSGELITAACRAGVPHPPGYPLFVLLGNAFCRLPFSTPAGRVGLLSVAAGVCAVLLLYGVAVRITGNRFAAAAAALTLATASTFWRSASHAEVFALNVALCLGVIYAALRARTAGSARGRAIGSGLLGLLAGLALCNHHSAVFVVLAAPAAVLLPLRPLRAAALRCGLALAGFAAGLSPYLFLLFAPRGRLPRWGDTSSLAGLVHHLLRRDYGTLSLALQGKPARLANLGHYLAQAPQQLGWVLWPICLVGLVALLLRTRGRSSWGGSSLEGRLPRELAVALAVLPLLVGPAFMLLFNISPEGIGAQVVERFHVLPDALLALWLAVGLAAIDAAWLARPGQGQRRVLARAAIGLVLVLSALRAFPRANLRPSYAVEDYVTNLLRTADRNAMVLGTGDALLFGALYVQEMLGVRRDVQYVDVQMLGHPWYVAQKQKERRAFTYQYRPRFIDTVSLIRGAMERGVPVYLAVAYSETPLRAYRGYPVGPLFRLLAPGAASPSPPEVARINERVFRGFVRRGRPPDPALDPWAAALTESFARTWLEIARGLRAVGEERPARAALAEAASWAPWLAAARGGLP